MSIDDEIRAHLERLGVVPLLGGLIPENATAELLGYAPSCFAAWLLLASLHCPTFVAAIAGSTG